LKQLFININIIILNPGVNEVWGKNKKKLDRLVLHATVIQDKVVSNKTELNKIAKQ